MPSFRTSCSITTSGEMTQFRVVSYVQTNQLLSLCFLQRVRDKKKLFTIIVTLFNDVKIQRILTTQKIRNQGTPAHMRKLEHALMCIVDQSVCQISTTNPNLPLANTPWAGRENCIPCTRLLNLVGVSRPCNAKNGKLSLQQNYMNSWKMAYGNGMTFYFIKNLPRRSCNSNSFWSRGGFSSLILCCKSSMTTSK